MLIFPNVLKTQYENSTILCLRLVSCDISIVFKMSIFVLHFAFFFFFFLSRWLALYFHDNFATWRKFWKIIEMC